MGWEWEYSPGSLDAETETTLLYLHPHLYPSGLDRLSLEALRACSLTGKGTSTCRQIPCRSASTGPLVSQLGAQVNGVQGGSVQPGRVDARAGHCSLKRCRAGCGRFRRRGYDDIDAADEADPGSLVQERR